DEHVGRAVRVTGDEVGRKADERDEATVGREGGGEGEAEETAAAVALSPVGGNAHPLGRARLPVVDEHVGYPVRVAGDEVGRRAVEGEEAAVGREGGPPADVVALSPFRREPTAHRRLRAVQ